MGIVGVFEESAKRNIAGTLVLSQRANLSEIKVRETDFASKKTDTLGIVMHNKVRQHTMKLLQLLSSGTLPT